MRGDVRFTPMNLALGLERGEATFQRNAASPSSSFLKVSRAHVSAFPGTGRRRKSGSQSIPGSDGAALNLETPMFVKIDVQGFEEQVLRGGEATIRRASVLLVETSFEAMYEGQTLFDGIYTLLRGWGFEFKGNLDQAHAPADGRLLQADSLFVSQELMNEPPSR